MKLLKVTILFLNLLIAILSFFCSNDAKVIQVKNWKILYEQDKSLESVLQKSGWKPVTIPLNFKSPYPPIKDFQFVWLKGELYIENDPSDYYGLSTGRIRLSDKIYVNNS